MIENYIKTLNGIRKKITKIEEDIHEVNKMAEAYTKRILRLFVRKPKEK